MTERADAGNRQQTPAASRGKTMRDVSQRNPWDPENVMGRVFRRGPTVATDGGKRQPRDTDDEDDAGAATEQKMKDVDQTPPHEDSTANRVWERGGETQAPDASSESTRDTAEE